MTPERFKTIRLEAEMTQEQLAEYLGSKARHVSVYNWETGRNEIKRPVAIAMEILALKGADWVSRNLLKEDPAAT